jgi:eukaryotic-like serine/threonine-protein kinase
MRRSYEITHTVGTGGMGTVYQARLRGAGDFEKDVALKILNDAAVDDSDDLGRRLRDEARILGLIRHRAVVHVDSLVRLGGRWTVVMEYIHGVDLQQLAQLVGAIPAGSALEIVGEVASALHVAYHTIGPDGRELKLLHRDIKPANVRVTPVGEVKVLDFGVARADFDNREAETRQGGFGSLGYVPQERIDGLDVPAGDVYSLGVVLFEMLAGERYGQAHLVSKKHYERLDERLEQLAGRGVPTGVRELVRSMMAFEPGERLTAREVERRVVQLRAEVPGVLLRDWAEERIGKLAEDARSGLAGPGLTGEILFEDGDSSGAARPREILPVAAPRSPLAMRALGVVIAALVVGAVALGLLAMGLGGVLVGKYL